MDTKGILSRCSKYHPLAALLLTALSGTLQAAEINSHSVNGVTVIDINSANANGISHNIYDRFNVDKNGLIFNNSQGAVTTTLAGDIAGNSNLATGAAKVILNEVTSKNQSALQGWMEVAGEKAHLIIANPNGISCQGCGFINAEKVTVTTGKPDMQNGMLQGYSVNGGLITLNGMTSTSPTEILARSVMVNGVTQAEALSVVAGNNYIDFNGDITGTLKAQGSRQTYGIDVAAIGGMYANKISLISNEKGVGVRNSGMIASTTDISIDSSGQLVNNHGQIKSAQLASIKTLGSLDNTTGKINSGGDLYIDSAGSTINNNLAGEIAAQNDLFIDSGLLNNVNGALSAGNTLGINTHKQSLINSGKGASSGIQAAIVALQTGVMDNKNGVIKGHYVGIDAVSLNNRAGVIEASGDAEITSSANIENDYGLIRATAGHVYIDAATSTLNNGNTRTADTTSQSSQGIIAGEGGIQIKSGTINNRTGQIAAKGDIAFISSAGIDNFQGKFNSGKQIYIKADSLLNGQAGISSKDTIHIELAKDFTNSIGIIYSDAGDIELQARLLNNKGGLLTGQNVTINAKSAVDNSNALLVANKNLVINVAGQVDNRNGNNFGRDYGHYLAMPNQQGGMVGRESVTINATSVNNENSQIVAEFGTLNITAKDKINNARSQIIANTGDSILKAQTINNDYGIISSEGGLSIDAGSLSNLSAGSITDNSASGIISARQNLLISTDSTFTNYGWINSDGNTTLNIGGVFSNRNTLNAGQNLGVTASNYISNYKDMAAGAELILTTASNLNNSAWANISGAKVVIDVKNEIANRGTIVSDQQLTVNSGGNIYNYSNLFTLGTAKINSKGISNNGATALLGGVAGTELKTGILSNSGMLIGL